MSGCGVAGCERPHQARGWCDVHYARWLRHGDPLADVPVARRRRTPTGQVNYRAMLQRVRARRGPARGQPCSGCGGVAAAWLYDGTDPDEQRDGLGRRYSLDCARYRACCAFCHRRAVVDRRAELPRGVVPPALDVERAARLYRAGAASTGIARLMHVSPSAVITALRDHGVEIRTRPRTDHASTTPICHTDPETPIKSHDKDTGQSRPMHRDPTVGAAGPGGPAAPEGWNPC